MGWGATKRLHCKPSRVCRPYHPLHGSCCVCAHEATGVNPSVRESREPSHLLCLSVLSTHINAAWYSHTHHQEVRQAGRCVCVRECVGVGPSGPVMISFICQSSVGPARPCGDITSSLKSDGPASQPGLVRVCLSVCLDWSSDNVCWYMCVLCVCGLIGCVSKPPHRPVLLG